MKKIIYLFVLFFCISWDIDVWAQQEYAKEVDYTIQINSVKQELNNPVVCIHDRTYLPLRELAELLNLYVVWDEETQMIKISDIGFVADGDNTPVVLSGAEEVAYPSNFRVQINGYIKDLENPLYIIRDRAYLPLRELAELSGMDVDWLAESKTVEITMEVKEEQSEPIRIRFAEDGLFGFMDIEGNVIVEPQYVEAGDFSEGLAAVANEEYRYGYIDVDGNLIIPHKYYRAQCFSEGRAAVIREEYVSIVNEGILLVPISPFTYIDREGNVAIETDFDEAGEFHDGVAAVCMVDDEGHAVYNYIDQSGNFQTDYSYYDAIPLNDFQNGYAVKGKTIIDLNFEKVFDGLEYDSIAFGDGWITAEKNGKYGVVDMNNNIVIDFQYDRLSACQDGLFAYESNGRCGYIDANENVIIPPIYSRISTFKNGIAMAEPQDNPNIMYLINRKGEQISKDLKRCAYNRDPSGVFMLMETEDSGQFIDFNGEKIGPVMKF